MQRSLILWVLVLLSVGEPFSLTGAWAQPKPPVKIGVIEKLTGSGSQVGIMWRDGVLLAIDEINASGGLMGSPIQPILSNLSWERAAAAEAMRALVSQNPLAIIGPVHTGLTLASMDITKEEGLPQFTASPSLAITQKGYPNIFRVHLTDAVIIFKGLRYVLDELKLDRIALIYVNDDYGQSARLGVNLYLKGRGKTLVAEVPAEPQQRDYKKALSQVKQAKAQVLIVVLPELEASFAVRQAREMKLKVEIVGGEPLCSPTTIGLAGPAMEGVKCHVSLTPDAPLETIQQVVKRFEARYGVKPDHNALKAYMAVYVFKAAVEEAGALDPGKVISCLHGLTISAREEPGILVDVYFDEKGDMERESFFVEVKEGKQHVFRIVPPLKGPFPPKSCS
ncbi:MAG: amino acid ABC transporter substrate-binding protein [candidate division NC10 bacterium]|nr:amino acid ABC transporter substrate-binding protein [candidate division NC10 bacterium]